MEILEIRSQRDLTVAKPEARPERASSFRVNCRQFVSAQKRWQNDTTHMPTLSVMTLDFKQIWITPAESEQVLAAIRAMSSPVLLDSVVTT